MGRLIYLYDNRTNKIIYAALTLLEIRGKINELNLLTKKEYYELRERGYYWKGEKGSRRVKFENCELIEREYPGLDD